MGFAEDRPAGGPLQPLPTFRGLLGPSPREGQAGVGQRPGSWRQQRGVTAALSPDFRVLGFWPFPTCSPGGPPPLRLPGRQGRKLGSESLLESRAGGCGCRATSPALRHQGARLLPGSQPLGAPAPRLTRGRGRGRGTLSPCWGAGPQLQEGSQRPSGRTTPPDPCP